VSCGNPSQHQSDANSTRAGAEQARLAVTGLEVSSPGMSRSLRPECRRQVRPAIGQPAGLLTWPEQPYATAATQSLTPRPVDPALLLSGREPEGSELHGPALPGMDFRKRAGSNFSSNIVSETGSTGFVESLVRLQAETAGDDFLHDLGGAAEDRLDMADPPELTIVAESSGLNALVLPPINAGSI
jgi:hypothetical protein